jgi:hypothetical protein
MPQLRIELYNEGLPPKGRPVSCDSTARIIGSQFVRRGVNRLARVFDGEEPLYDIKATDNSEFYVIERYGITSSDVEIPSECEGCGHTRHLPVSCSAQDCCCGAIEGGEYDN